MITSTEIPMLNGPGYPVETVPFSKPGLLNATWLRTLVLETGADDVGFVEIARPELDDQRGDILASFPRDDLDGRTTLRKHPSTSHPTNRTGQPEPS